jgi:hypothetical protein
MPGIGEIHQLALEDVHQRQQAAIEQQGNDEGPFQGGHGADIAQGSGTFCGDFASRLLKRRQELSAAPNQLKSLRKSVAAG